MVLDPVSIVVLTNASLGIARSLVHTINELYELAEQYETAALGIRTVATQCNSFRVAIQRISTWLTKQDESSRHNLDDEFWQALADNLDTGTLVIDDLERRIKGLKKDSAKFWTRTKYLWNSGVISELQSQIQGLMSAVSILIQVIDMPTAGGRRSQSLAQRSRLNNITKSVRETVEQRRQRIQKTQEQSLLDEVDGDMASGALQQPLPTSTSILAEQRTEVFKPVHAPPPYDAATSEGTAKTLDQSDSKEEKTKRSKWMMGFKKRSSTPKVEQVARTSSGTAEDNSKDATQSSAPSNALNPFDDSNRLVQETPRRIDTYTETDEYFGIQMAMAGMSMLTPIQGSTGEFPDTRATQNVTENDLTKVPSIVTPPVEADTGLPSVSKRQGASDTTRSMSYGGLSELGASESDSMHFGNATEPSYYPPPLDSSKSATISPPLSSPTTYASASPQPTAFERIRPSQRVREAREDSRSRSQDPSRNVISAGATSTPRASTPSLVRTGSKADITTQTWRTTPTAPTSVNNSLGSLSKSTHLRLKITYDPTLYTSRISHSAAHALHLLEHALTNTIDNVPIANLTLLYVVSDGENQSVMGDEVELEVMHEEDARGMEIVFGAGQIHVGAVMEGAEGGVMWWSERAVPRGLRTVEGLRLFRRFELSRW